MPAQWTFQDAKNKFSEVVKAASAGQPQVVEEQGVPAVVVISNELYEYYKKPQVRLNHLLRKCYCPFPKMTMIHCFQKIGRCRCVTWSFNVFT